MDVQERLPLALVVVRLQPLALLPSLALLLALPLATSLALLLALEYPWRSRRRENSTTCPSPSRKSATPSPACPGGYPTTRHPSRNGTKIGTTGPARPALSVPVYVDPRKSSSQRLRMKIEPRAHLELTPPEARRPIVGKPDRRGLQRMTTSPNRPPTCPARSPGRAVRLRAVPGLRNPFEEAGRTKNRRRAQLHGGQCRLRTKIAGGLNSAVGNNGE